MAEEGTLVKFESYTNFYNFLIDFIQFLIETKVVTEKPKIFYTYIEILTEDREYEEYYLFRKERKYEIDMSSIESFTKSVIIPINSRYDDERVAIENLIDFSYTHNAGYSRVSKLDPHTGWYKKEVVYDGFPTKVSFEAFLKTENDKIILLNEVKVPLEKLKKIVKENNGKIILNYIKY